MMKMVTNHIYLYTKQGPMMISTPVMIAVLSLGRQQISVK